VPPIQWFALAAKTGDTEAAERRNQVKAELDQQTLAAAQQAVKSWKVKAANPKANEVAFPRRMERVGLNAEWALVTRAQTLLNKLSYDASFATRHATPSGLSSAAMGSTRPVRSPSRSSPSSSA
jgi:hypothetical protein